MTKGVAFRTQSGPAAPLAFLRVAMRRTGLAIVIATALLFALAAAGSPLLADAANAATAPPPSTQGVDFGQYLADHQEDLSPFFLKNADALIKQAIPLVMGLMGWIILGAMVIGWAVDVLLSRVYAAFFAPAFADFKRSLIYATGSLVLSFIYTLLMGLAVVLGLGLAHSVIVIGIAMVLLLLVAFAAQLVWILFLYRTDVPISAAFYVALIVAHTIVGFLIAGPVMGPRADRDVPAFVNQAITPKLHDEIALQKHQLALATSARDAVQSQIGDVQDQISRIQTEQEQLRREIEAKKNSDVYVFSQIAKLRATGNLASTRIQLAAFVAQFPTSRLYTVAQAQLADVDNEIAAQEARQKQQQADATRAAAQARADLLARAAKGEVTLSEIRQVLIGKTRNQVSDLLGLPAETGPDRWTYRQQMIVNPLTNEKSGLTVYFLEDAVQGVDYYRGGGPQ